ncbi:MAG TPA: FlgO family outer membrane protein [Rhodoferax sp.]|nr:FlgO family outer membrane protein [Rhodoferax sp.]
MTRLLQRGVLAIAGLLGLAGCVTNDPQQCTKEKLSALVAVAEVSQVFDDIALGFCPANCVGELATGSGACAESAPTKLVLVPDFVSITNYLPGVAGLYMGEQMRAALSQRCSSQIYQAEFGRDLKLSEEGLVALTRNPGEVVRDEFRGQDILIGTYSFNGNRLAMFIRKINSTSGVISKMVSKEVVYNCGFMGTMAKIIK